MLLISGANVSKSYGSRVCLRDAAFEVHSGRRVGFIGANGTGKTTLMRIMRGEEDCEGTVTRRQALRIVSMDQAPSHAAEATVREIVTGAIGEVGAIQSEMSAIHHALSDDAPDERQTERLMARLVRLESRFEAAGGHDVEWRVDAALDGVGFPAERHDEPFGTLSGGEQSRVSLARLLLQEADVWLLDEPTNHLDLDGIEYLERCLQTANVAAVIISHDRRFLDRATSETWELSGGRLEVFPGSYSRSREVRAQRRREAWRLYLLQETHIRKQEDFIRRYRSGQRAKQARGRETRLKRLERVERPEDSERVAALHLPQPPRLGSRVLDVKGLSAGYGGGPVFRDVTFELAPGETLGIVGPNGCGKTTLLRALLGELKPIEGEARWGATVERATLGQHDTFPDESITPLDYLRASGQVLREQDLRDTLAVMLFGGDDVGRPVRGFSGGEKRRLMLTRLLLEGHNVLLLDEPTNHLDVDSREMLELALGAYDGSIVVVSHDRYFLDQIADRVLWLEEGGWHMTWGGFEEAGAAHTQRREAAREAERRDREARRSKVVVGKRERRRKQGPHARLTTDELEDHIIACEEHIERLRAGFADPDIYRDGEKMRELSAEVQRVEGELAELEAEYETRGS